jgi:hypothetical protein
MTAPPRFVFFLTAVAGMAGLPSCTGIPRGWRQAKAGEPRDDATGAWVGTWRSHVNGHHGGLRAVVEPPPGQPAALRFRYRASWMRVLCAGFTVDCTGTREADGSLTVSGAKDLGRAFGGRFQHTGSIRHGRLTAAYSSAMDHGVMELRRLNPTPTADHGSAGTGPRP